KRPVKSLQLTHESSPSLWCTTCVKHLRGCADAPTPRPSATWRVGRPTSPSDGSDGRDREIERRLVESSLRLGARGGDRTRTSRRRGGFKTSGYRLFGVVQSVECAVICRPNPCSLSSALSSAGCSQILCTLCSSSRPVVDRAAITHCQCGDGWSASLGDLCHRGRHARTVDLRTFTHP